jgi:antitoxin ParD1/3/4
MSTMNISLPESLKSFVDEQVCQFDYASSSEYVRELIRKDKDRSVFRQLLLEGRESPRTDPVSEQYFASLRDRIQRHSKA